MRRSALLVGIALGGEDGDSIDHLTRSADLALYTAKSDGRGQHAFYRSDMRAAADDRRRLINDLTEALARGQLEVLYQPIIGAASQQVEAYEALLRWEHPERGTIPPDLFIPIAEEAGLINRIGSWVLRTAAETAMGLAGGHETGGQSVRAAGGKRRARVDCACCAFREWSAAAPARAGGD